MQNTTAKQIPNESKDKCVPGKHAIRKERNQINEPYTKESCKNVSHIKAGAQAKSECDGKDLKKEVHKDQKDVVERCFAESSNKIKSQTNKDKILNKIEEIIIPVIFVL